MSEPGPEPAERSAQGALLAAALFCAVLLFSWLLAAELFHALWGDRPRLVLIGAQVVGILLPALALSRAFASLGLPPRTSPLPPPGPRALALAIPGLAISGYLLGLAIHLTWLRALEATGWEWVHELERFLSERYGELLVAESAGELALVLLTVSLVPAVCEEVAFRRGLQGLLASRGGASRAVLTSAIVFSAFHLEPFGLPTRFFLGVSLGVAYHRTGRLWVPGVLHAAHNLATVAGLQLSDRSEGLELSTFDGLAAVPPGLVITFGALGLGGWLASLGLLRPAARREAA